MELQDRGEVTKTMSGFGNIILENIFEDSARLDSQESIMSSADAEQAALLLLDEIIFLHKKFKKFLALSEQSIQKTFMKWTEKKKRANFSEAYPKMPSKHRPDFDCLYGQWSLIKQKNEQIYLTPLLNLEDFLHDNKSYGRVTADLAVLSGADLNSNLDTFQTPGSFDPGHGILVLHAQKQMLRFLVRVCELLLSGKKLVPENNIQSNPVNLLQSREPDSFVTMKIHTV